MNDDAVGFFDPRATIEELSGTLPHWRQGGVTYFVTFRLADSIPQELLRQWSAELDSWRREHPEPYDEQTRRTFYSRFPHRLQNWIDADYGTCVLRIPEVRQLVETALGYFHGVRYVLDASVVAPNHVHALVTPLEGWDLSNILHSWKSFSAHEILKVEAASRRFKEMKSYSPTRVWQKESFDHIVRSPESLEKYRRYIRDHRS